jgi:hypothetical protein
MTSLVLFLLLWGQASEPAAANEYTFYRSETQQPESDATYPCGVMSEQLDTHKMQKTTHVAVSKEKALLYVMVEYGGFYQNRIGVDGHWVGATKGTGTHRGRTGTRRTSGLREIANHGSGIHEIEG